MLMNKLYFGVISCQTLILLKMQPQLLSNSNMSTSKIVYFPLVIKSFSVEHQIDSSVYFN